MTARLCFFLLLISTPLFGISQRDDDNDWFKYFNKGKNLVGLETSIGLGAKPLVQNANLHCGRFWLKKFNAGLQVGLSTNGGSGMTTYSGPFARYYFLSESFTPFLEANYTYGLTWRNNGAPGTDWKEGRGSVQVLFSGVGLSYTGILKRFGVDVYGGYARA